MLRRAFSLCAVLGLVSTANAGVVVTLMPNGGTFDLNNPGSLTFTVDVLARLTDPTVAPVPGAPAARLRLAQFDIGASSPEIVINPVTMHTGLETGIDITFWDFSTTSNCTTSPELCGDNNFIDGSISADDILNATYIGQTTSGPRQLSLTTADKRLGQLEITLPAVEGTYILDVLNETAPGDAGAAFVYGFGTPTDPTVTNEADSSVPALDVTGGRATFTVIPEPATLAMLGLGGLAAAFRRRRSA